MTVKFYFERESTGSRLVTYSRWCGIGFVQALQAGDHDFDVCRVQGWEFMAWSIVDEEFNPLREMYR